MPTQGWEKWFPRVRDLTSFVTGMGLVVYEATAGGKTLEVMLVGVAISGLPIPFWLDAKRKGDAG